MNDDRKDEDMICGLTADEFAALQRGLRSLPETMPPRVVWRRIVEQAEAEGLVRRPLGQRRSTWYAGFGIAAAALLVAVMLPNFVGGPAETFSPVPDNVPSNSIGGQTVLQTLMVESRRLENDLRALPDGPRVMRAGTMATISDLEDRIAAIDYELHDPAVVMSDEDRELFWRERVRLMKLLLQLRYAQAQRAAF